MPNWAGGFLKLRGEKENIAQALKYMFCTADNVEIEEDLEIGWFELTTTAPYFYINGTRRAFIDRKRIEVWLEEEICIVELDNFKQAWSAIPEIIKKFQVSLMLILKFLRLSVAWNSRKKLKFQKAKSSKTFAMNMMIINGKFHSAI